MIKRAMLLSAMLPMVLAAQVGHPPAQSPFRDVSAASRLGVFGGWYVGANDRAGVLPKGGPMVGLRWDVGVGGPADIAIRVASVSSDRDVIDPSQPVGERIVENKSLKLGLADVGLAFNLTGQRSWHRFVPSANVSVGLVSDFQGRDVGGYRHGTTFALGYGLGVRYVPPSGRLTLRGDLGSYFYSQQYPSSYFNGAAEGTSVVPTSESGAKWRNNWMFTLGAAYRLFE